VDPVTQLGSATSFWRAGQETLPVAHWQSTRSDSTGACHGLDAELHLSLLGFNNLSVPAVVSELNIDQRFVKVRKPKFPDAVLADAKSGLRVPV
jgi:hypothetical protein